MNASNFPYEGWSGYLDALFRFNFRSIAHSPAGFDQLDQLARFRNEITPSHPLRFLPSTQELADKVTGRTYFFFLSSKSDRFVTSSIWSEADQKCAGTTERHYGDVIPPAYVLKQLGCLFEVSKQRDPVYHTARVAHTFREWSELNWSSAMGHISRTRCRGTFDIRVAWTADFRAAVERWYNVIGHCTYGS